MKTPVLAQLVFVFAAVLVCATASAQTQRQSQLGEMFKPEMSDCATEPPPGFSPLPKAHLCEIENDNGSFSVSLKSAVPCGCEVTKTAVSIGNFRVVPSDDIKCIAGGAGQITVTTKPQTRTVFVATGEIAFFRADDNGEFTCRTAHWRDFSELVKSLEWPEAKPETK